MIISVNLTYHVEIFMNYQIFINLLLYDIAHNGTEWYLIDARRGV